MSRTALRWIILFSALSVLIAFFALGGSEILSLGFVKNHIDEFENWSESNLVLAIVSFMTIYILAASLSIPGAVVLTLAGGALFGTVLGSLIVSVSSTLGATLAFLASRFLFQERIEAKFQKQLEAINKGLLREGGIYVLTLRLIPLFPFFLVNLALGVTRISVKTYFFLSLVGMLPATIVYVNAGKQLSEIESISDVANPNIIGALVLLGLLPVFGKAITTWLRARKLYAPFVKPKKFEYDLIAIGGGSAGLVSAYIAAAGKAKAALVEMHKMGGDCLNTGCVPSKALIRSSRISELLRKSSEFGIHASNVQVDFPAVMERIQQVITQIEPHDSVERYTGLGVDCFKGKAFIRSPFEVEVNGKTFTTRNIVIATGARPRVPNIPGLSEISFKTSDTIWSLRKQPKRLLVVGGGPIGCELAQAFQLLGTQVTILDSGPRIFPKEDADAAELVERNLRKAGMQIFNSAEILRFTKAGESQSVEFRLQNQIEKFEFDEVLVAVGRQANVTGFGLEELGIGTTPSGTIEVDECLQTKYPNILACGDVAGPFQFTHAASHQAWFASVNALARPFKSFAADYRFLPWVTFTSPEIARVGLNETDAKAKAIPFEITKYGLDDLDRAIADGTDEGFVKVLTRPGTDQILGVTIVGEHAGELIPEFVTCMKHGLGLGKILGTIHAYPTMSEANKYAAGVWRRAHAPQTALKFLEKFHSWRRG